MYVQMSQSQNNCNDQGIKVRICLYLFMASGAVDMICD